MAASSLDQWALPRLQQLLPLDDDTLRQVLRYADSLPKDQAAEHLKSFLGDDGRALEFIASFNLRRQNAPPALPQTATMPAASGLGSGTASASASGPASTAGSTVPPRAGAGRGRGGGRKRAQIHSLPARQLEGQGNVQGAYVKSRDEEDYMPRANERQKHKDTVADNLALREKPSDATHMPLITGDTPATQNPITSKKPPPSAAGPLVSDSLAAKSPRSSRNQSPANKKQVNISGGTPMHGASSTLSDLDSAIRSLELQTNPVLSSSSSASDIEKRCCNCMATRHPLLDVAPNCLSCGRIICVKQGLGPCLTCNTPLLGAEEISKVLRVLKDERGEERMKANNASHKRAEVAHGKVRALTGRDFLAQTSSSTHPSPLSSATASDDDGSDDAVARAKAHRDKLLGFQAHNARRTRVHDQAADFDVPAAGTNMWASPAERALQLKRQQKVLRDMEWNARPDYEKRRVVASIDVQKGRIVRKMAEVERPKSEPESDDDDRDDNGQSTLTGGAAGGAFSSNPLAAGLVKPRARESSDAVGGDKGKVMDAAPRTSLWRRVQMDEDDNEQWILDGGMYGGAEGNEGLLRQDEDVGVCG